MVVGATGLIGSAVAARLSKEGHDILGVGRTAAADSLAVAQWLRLDLREATSPSDWLPHLAGIEAVVYCAGVLQDSGRDSTSRVHRDGPAALWRACEQSAIRRVIHFSALGADRGAPTDFSRTKAEGDAALEASGLDYVILRPSVVVGNPAYGGSALFRGLAALPLLPRIPDAGALEIVQLSDVTETVARLVRGGAPSRVALELIGPDRLEFEQVVAAYRAWLGWKPARIITGPTWLMTMACRIGDAIARLGWRPPIRSTARREIVRGAIGDPGAWRDATGIEPQGLAAALAGNPSSAQERWFAKLYLLKPLVIGIFALFWLLTGLVSLGPGYELAKTYMLRAGGGPLSALCVISGAIADIAIFGMMVWRPTTRLALYAAILLSAVYLVAGTVLLPELWRDPLGPILKIWPILALNFVCLAILDER